MGKVKTNDNIQKQLDMLDKEITSLIERLDNIKGTATEVYTRIVGYYRSINNWNAGKQAEYKNRMPFKRSIKDEI